MVVITYRKSKNAKKVYMKVFPNLVSPDRLNNLRARKPLIPNEYVIEDMGIGESFIELYKKKQKIKNHEVDESR